MTESAIAMIRAERERILSLWGRIAETNEPTNDLFEWMSILGEEFGERCEAINDTCFKHPKHPERGGYDNILKEAIQVAAVSTAIAEDMLQRKAMAGEEKTDQCR